MENELKNNWYALILCILRNKTIDEALNVFEIITNKYRIVGKKKNSYSVRDIEKILYIKKVGMKNKDIAEYFGITRSQVKAIIQYHSKRKGR
ncbi:hypothetical protein [Clostridium felsineum]|uniref:hypothetical protein n=1 Tax=Clostridium felsineum TaxID=36839 RepID=UPI0011157BCD|nr:hypothetical protein [Clostridium felsineum]